MAEVVESLDLRNRVSRLLRIAWVYLVPLSWLTLMVINEVISTELAWL